MSMSIQCSWLFASYAMQSLVFLAYLVLQFLLYGYLLMFRCSLF